MFLLNRDPEPNEVGHPLDENIILHVCDDSGADVVYTDVDVYVDGALAVDAGVAQSGWAVAFTSIVVGQLKAELNPDSDFTSEQAITVRVVATNDDDTDSIDESYGFACEDTTAPVIVSVVGIALDTLRLTFDEAVVEADALTLANYTLERLLAPSVEAEVSAVTKVADEVYDLTTDIELSHDMTYRLTVDDVKNLNYVPTSAATYDFDAYCPEIPADREFELWEMIPQMNRDEDTSEDLAKWIGCLQEVTDLLLFDIDAWANIIDPDTADEQYVDAMLADLGNPFSFAASLNLIDKRRLVKLLLPIYQQKGTEVGIINVVRLFMGIDITFIYGAATDTMELGISELGGSGGGDVEGDWILGTSDQALLYSFWVEVQEVLIATQRTQLTRIVEYMKPAHTHFLGINEPTPPVTYDHLELGISELGVEWQLH
jgi:phage tail-like protein